MTLVAQGLKREILGSKGRVDGVYSLLGYNTRKL